MPTKYTAKLECIELSVTAVELGVPGTLFL